MGILAFAATVSCSKAPVIEDENAWIDDDTKPVPVLFNTTRGISAQTKAIVTGSVMNSLDVGIIGVAEKTGDGNESVAWDPAVDWTILIDNKKVTTGVDGSITLSPKVYYPFGNKYAYTFYSYYPYQNSESQAAVIGEGKYSITYSLGDTDILWAKAEATDFEGIKGFNAKYCRAVSKSEIDNKNDYLPKLPYKHLLTALDFKVKSNDSDIDSYDIKVTGMELVNTHTSASLCVCDNSQSTSTGTLTPSGNGRIGRTDLNVKPSTSSRDLCTILAYPATSYTAEITIKFTYEEQTKTSVVSLPINGSESYNSGYIYSFIVTVNKPEEVTIVQTTLEEWKDGTAGAEEI